MRVRTYLVVVFTMLATLAVPLPSAHAGTLAQGDLTQFQFPRGAGALTPGPDGNVWLAGSQAYVSLITPTGDVTEFPISTTGGGDLVAGPDDRIWVVHGLANKITAVTTAGVETVYPLPTPGSGPSSITVGADGNLWFTEFFATQIGRITPSGEVTEFPIDSRGASITLGPDGNVWFTKASTNMVSSMAPDGTLTEFPTTFSPGAIVASPEGTLWVNQRLTSKVVEFALDGTVLQVVPLASDNNRLLDGIVAGPDGNIYVNDTDYLYRVTPAGDVDQVRVTSGQLLDVTAGPDGNIWLTDWEYLDVYRGAIDGAAISFYAPYEELDIFSPVEVVGSLGLGFSTDSAGRTIHLMRSGPGDDPAVEVATLVTEEDGGRFDFDDAPPSPGTYTYHAVWDGDATHAAVISGSDTVEMLPHQSWMTLDAEWVATYGEATPFQVDVSLPAPTTNTQVTATYAGKPLAPLTIDASGLATGSFTPSTAGVLEVTWAGDTNYTTVQKQTYIELLPALKQKLSKPLKWIDDVAVYKRPNPIKIVDTVTPTYPGQKIYVLVESCDEDDCNYEFDAGGFKLRGKSSIVLYLDTRALKPRKNYRMQFSTAAIPADISVSSDWSYFRVTR